MQQTTRIKPFSSHNKEKATRNRFRGLKAMKTTYTSETLASPHTRRRKPHATDNKNKKKFLHRRKPQENRFRELKAMKATRNRFKGLKANKKMTILQQSNETKKFFVCARYLEPQGTLRPPSQGEHATSSPRLEKIEKRNPLQEFWLDLARGLRRESKPSQGLEVANQPRRTGSFVMARAQWNGHFL